MHMGKGCAAHCSKAAIQHAGAGALCVTWPSLWWGDNVCCVYMLCVSAQSVAGGASHEYGRGYGTPTAHALTPRGLPPSQPVCSSEPP